MLNYQTALDNVFATGEVPDGYFGKVAAVQFSLIGQRVVTVADCGCFNAGLPDVIDAQEAIWLLQHHPSSTARNVAPI